MDLKKAGIVTGIATTTVIGGLVIGIVLKQQGNNTQITNRTQMSIYNNEISQREESQSINEEVQNSSREISQISGLHLQETQTMTDNSFPDSSNTNTSSMYDDNTDSNSSTISVEYSDPSEKLILPESTRSTVNSSSENNQLDQESVIEEKENEWAEIEPDESFDYESNLLPQRISIGTAEDEDELDIIRNEEALNP